ncbi:hypothetical protein ACE10Z_10085 [Bradyrhizobium sp. Pha-3]
MVSTTEANVHVRRVLPHPALRGIIRSFGERRGSLGSKVLT